MNNNQNINFRNKIFTSLLPYAEEDSSIIVLAGDMGFAVADSFVERFPERFVNAGIMEQGTVGIAAGMAAMGMKPIVYSIVNFLVFRALEQIRNDIVLQNFNVKLIATGANDYFRKLGHSHCCGNDDIRLMELAGIKVYDPYAENSDYNTVFHNWITSPDPGYLRV